MIRPATASTLLLLSAAWWWRVQLQADEAIADNPDDPDNYTPGASSWADDMAAALSTARNLVAPTPAAGMRTSAAGLAHLAQFEGLRLTRYRLGDGGWTIGRGRYYPDGGPVPPERITLAQADAWFAEDVADRGERWVRAYVTAPLTQGQFDALVSMAYNLSPRSFRRIADAVNAGEGPEVMALQYVRAGTHLERGLRNRRAAEFALYHSDTATA